MARTTAETHGQSMKTRENRDHRNPVLFLPIRPVTGRTPSDSGTPCPNSVHDRVDNELRVKPVLDANTSKIHYMLLFSSIHSSHYRSFPAIHRWIISDSPAYPSHGTIRAEQYRHRVLFSTSSKRNLNHYEVLGVSSHASSAEIMVKYSC